MAGYGQLNRETLADLQEMLHQVNPCVRLYKTASERITQSPAVDLRIRLIEARTKDARVYNAPTADEIGAIMVGDGNDGASDCDIVVQARNGFLRRVSALHAAYSPMHYVLLFPDGRDGWHPNIPLNGFGMNFECIDPNAVAGKRGSKRVSQAQFYAYLLQERDEFSILLRGGRLLQEYLVDAYACVEQNRLNYLRMNQKKLRVELYSGLHDALNAGDDNAAEVGRKFILPSSFSGGPRQMKLLYQDAMAIVCKYGKPDLFVTFTCNPKWPEITRELKEGQDASDRPDLVSHVFHMKLRELLNDINNGVLGTPIAKVWVIEFQKRGLPHAHLLIILEDQSKMRTPEEFDTMVSAEFPDAELYPNGFQTVASCMVHGPCGVINPTSPCMEDGICKKKYPRNFNEQTSCDEAGYPLYRRRNTGQTFTINRGNTQYEVDNRWVVPHNLYLCTKYNAHINVEVRAPFFCDI